MAGLGEQIANLANCAEQMQKEKKSHAFETPLLGKGVQGEETTNQTIPATFRRSIERLIQLIGDSESRRKHIRELLVVYDSFYKVEKQPETIRSCLLCEKLLND